MYKESFLLALQLCNTRESSINWLKCCVNIYRRSDSSDHSNFDVITFFAIFAFGFFISNHTLEYWLMEGSFCFCRTWLFDRFFSESNSFAFFFRHFWSLFAFKIRLWRALSMCTLQISFGFSIKSIDLIANHQPSHRMCLAVCMPLVNKHSYALQINTISLNKSFEILDSTSRTHLNLLVDWIPCF